MVNVQRGNVSNRQDEAADEPMRGEQIEHRSSEKKESGSSEIFCVL